MKMELIKVKTSSSLEPPVGIEPMTCSLRVRLPAVPRDSGRCICAARALLGTGRNGAAFCGNCYDNCYEAGGALIQLSPRLRGGVEMYLRR